MLHTYKFCTYPVWSWCALGHKNTNLKCSVICMYVFALTNILHVHLGNFLDHKENLCILHSYITINAINTINNKQSSIFEYFASLGFCNCHVNRTLHVHKACGMSICNFKMTPIEYHRQTKILSNALKSCAGYICLFYSWMPKTVRHNRSLLKWKTRFSLYQQSWNHTAIRCHSAMCTCNWAMNQHWLTPAKVTLLTGHPSNH